MSAQRIAVVAVRSLSAEIGGAERLCEGLVAALNSAGVHADLLNVASDESSFESIEETYLRCYDLDLSAYDAVISTKAPSYLVRHPNHVCYLVHTMRVFYDRFDAEFPDPSDAVREQRRLIHRLDTAALSPPRTRKVFSIGHEVSRRLLEWNGISNEVLHPALAFDAFRPGRYGEYLFMPGRLHRWKRVDLMIQALRHVGNGARLKIAGTGEDERALRQLAAGDERIEFLGRVADEELVELYADTLAVPFVPVHEDYGYVTIEAFRSAKPVITCVDSGEPALFVKNWHTGFVCRPDPGDIGGVIDYLYRHRREAAAMGERARHSVGHLRWEDIATRLMSALTTG